MHMLESFNAMSEKFLPQFSALIYVYFEKYLREIVGYTTTPKRNTYHIDDKFKHHIGQLDDFWLCTTRDDAWSIFSHFLDEKIKQKEVEQKSRLRKTISATL